MSPFLLRSLYILYDQYLIQRKPLIEFGHLRYRGWGMGVRGNEKSDYTSIFLRNFEGSFIYNSSLMTIKCNNNAMFSFLRCFPRRSSELYIFSPLSKIQEVTLSLN
jgi:hypothetical protein